MMPLLIVAAGAVVFLIVFLALPKGRQFDNPDSVVSPLIALPSGTSTAPPISVSELADAIERAEGYNMQGSIPQRSNNPGDLTRSFGYPTLGTANAEGVLVFDSYQSGRAALEAQLNLIRGAASKVYSLSDTLSAMAVKWTGSSDAGAAWAGNVANYLGVSTESKLEDLLT